MSGRALRVGSWARSQALPGEELGQLWPAARLPRRSLVTAGVLGAHRLLTASDTLCPRRARVHARPSTCTRTCASRLAQSEASGWRLWGELAPASATCGAAAGLPWGRVLQRLLRLRVLFPSAAEQNAALFRAVATELIKAEAFLRRWWEAGRRWEIMFPKTRHGRRTIGRGRHRPHENNVALASERAEHPRANACWRRRPWVTQ